MKTHQEIARELDFYSVNENCLSGAPLYHPNGANVLDNLKEYVKKIHLKEGYQLVQTPLLYKNELWKTSGHYDKYRENMFFLDDGKHAVKPMNCPAHILIFKSRLRTHNELPLRFFEFGNVYRNELDGVTNGLFRCRAFTQDDSHIFLSLDSVEDEVLKILRLIDSILAEFGLQSKAYLSSSPPGSLDDSKSAEALVHLQKALERAGKTFEFKDGEGAFYGPKIDVGVKDSQGREWQLSTIQLDFNLPRRFDLQYQGKNGEMNEIVMIHRAILGSLDRFLAILLEETQGWLPPILASKQFAIVIMDEAYNQPVIDQVIEQMQKKGLTRFLTRTTTKIQLGKTFDELRKKRVRQVMLLGTRELQNGEITVKDLKTNQQQRQTIKTSDESA